MKRSGSLISCFLVLFLFSCKKDHQGCQTIVCGDFEDTACAKEHWMGNYDVASFANDESYNHSRSLKLTNTGVTTTMRCLVAGDSFDVSFHLRIDQMIPSPDHPYSTALGVSTDVENLELSFSNSDTSWTVRTYQFVAIADTEHLHIESGHTLYLDDIVVTPHK